MEEIVEKIKEFEASLKKLKADIAYNIVYTDVKLSDVTPNKIYNEDMVFSGSISQNDIARVTCFMRRKAFVSRILIGTSRGKYIMYDDCRHRYMTLNVPFKENIEFFIGKMDWKLLKNTTVTFGAVPNDPDHTYDLKEILDNDIVVGERSTLILKLYADYLIKTGANVK